MSRLPFLGAYADGKPAAIDLPRLLETRMLIQSASGFGKSWAVRRLLEVTAGQVQQLVIDPDGEYATLREKHDFVIAAAHDGDALAHPKTAALLARRLLETGVSAILDIYDLKPHERHAFVRIFLQALVDAPKALWRPVLTVVDEAHVYCPQVGESEAAGAVIDLATRGRKRGFGIVLATQRLSKLNKDAAAECLNKLIGRAGLDLDVKRAADDLGMTHREASEQLKKLEPGEFFAYGPALCPDVQRMKVGEVRTTHPKAGERSLVAPPKPTAAIKAVLPQLADLPKEAEQEARSLDDLKRELAAARRELTLANNARPGPSVADLKAAEDRGFASGVVESSQSNRRAAAATLKALRGALRQGIDTILDGAEQGLKEATALSAPHPITPVMPRPALGKPAASVQRPAPSSGSADASIGGGKRRMMIALAQNQSGLTKRKLSILVDIASTGGTFRIYLNELKGLGYVTKSGDLLRITPEGFDALGCYEPLPTGEALVSYWQTRLGNSGKRLMFDAIVGAYPGELSKEELASATDITASGGTFRIYLNELKALGLVEGKQALRASETLFA